MTCVFFQSLERAVIVAGFIPEWWPDSSWNTRPDNLGIHRLTRFQLQNLTHFVELNPGNSAVSQVIHFPEGSKWRSVTELLWVLGGRDSWPRDELTTWLSAEVLPLLAWSIDNGKGVKEDPQPEDPSVGKIILHTVGRYPRVHATH